MSTRKSGLDELLVVTEALMQGERAKDLVAKHEVAMASVKADDIVFLVDAMKKREPNLQQLKLWVSRLLNLMAKPLRLAKPDYEHLPTLLGLLEAENEVAKEELNQLKALYRVLLSSAGKDRRARERLSAGLVKLRGLELHYRRLQNLLFPKLSYAELPAGCMDILWSIQDEVKAGITECLAILKADLNEATLERFNRCFGKLSFDASALFFREHFIFFPVAFERLSSTDWEELWPQSISLGHALYEPSTDEALSFHDEQFAMGVGGISMSLLLQLLERLPVDLTYIDEQDKVRFFTEGPRVFPRSRAVIGLPVQRCHPPESLDRVQVLVDALRGGEKERESFWLELQGRFIHIEYQAVRDKDGRYRGVLEVVQDATNLRGLKGEKRLMDED